MAKSLRPDVVVMDFAMPRMDGAEATRQIKSLRQRTRVIGLSAFDQPDIEQRMLRAGVGEFFRKGENSDRLIASVVGGPGRR
jgi:DNA-binding NarL/FixJ family response regulator